MKVAVIGQGYVGLPLAIKISLAGHKVVGFDLNFELIKKLNIGNSHIEDVPNVQMEKAIESQKYLATATAKDLIDCEIVIIAVPTPLDSNRLPDLQHVISAAELLGKNLKRKTLVINESTSYPGTLRNIIAPTVLKFTPPGIDHLFAISPERVDPGNKEWDLSSTPRIIAGLTPESAKKALEFYSSFCKELIEVSSPEVAETAKLFENTFRQVNIALVNELALTTRALGISVTEVIEAASTKPYGFMKFSPGIGVGGHCIPIDPSYLAFAAESVGVKARFIELANSVNLQMPQEIVKRIKLENGGMLQNKDVLVCGLAYKSNIGDIRESPSVDLVGYLRGEGANVTWHDPLVETWKSEMTTNLGTKKFDITVVAILHDIMNRESILESSNYVFDCTGKLKSRHQL